MATLALVALAHAVLLTVAGAAGTQFLARPLPSMSVAFVDAPTPPAEPPRPLPLRAPTPLRVELPYVPPPEIAVRMEPTVPTVRAEPKPEPPPGEPAPRVVEAAPPRPEPPRADLAYLDNAAPAYPPISRRMREQGRVLLRVEVDPDGRVVAIELAQSSGHGRLDEAALAAARRWRFAPAKLGDTQVAGRALVPIVFQLNG